MADMNVGVTITRTDQRDALYDGAITTPDVNDAERHDRVIPAGAGSTEYNGWTSASDGSGSAITADPFNMLAVIVDPDKTVDDTEQDLGLWVKLYTTATAGGSSTAETNLVRVTRRCPLILSSAKRGTTVAGGKVVTKIGYLNDDATNDIPVRVIIQ